MKIFKKGFSLAEVLIALAIMSVIATAGYTIAQKGIERSFDMYIYTAYKDISNAIASADIEEKKLDSNDVGKPSVNIDDSDYLDYFSKYIVNLFNADDNAQYTTTRFNFTAQNGVRYVFEKDGSKYKILLSNFPQKRTTQSAIELKLLYTQSDEHGILIPIESQGIEPFIWDRMDLLPFYIDDGVVGRNISGQYQRRTYYSFRQAFCQIEDNPASYELPSTFCDGVPQATPNSGIIKLGHPRNL